MESGDRLNIAFVESTLDESMLTEVDDLDTTAADETKRYILFTLLNQCLLFRNRFFQVVAIALLANIYVLFLQ